MMTRSDEVRNVPSRENLLRPWMFRSPTERTSLPALANQSRAEQWRLAATTTRLKLFPPRGFLMWGYNPTYGYFAHFQGTLFLRVGKKIEIVNKFFRVNIGVKLLKNVCDFTIFVLKIRNIVKWQYAKRLQ